MSEYLAVAYQIIVAQEQEVEINALIFHDCDGNKKLYVINSFVELDSENSYKIDRDKSATNKTANMQIG
ncbi:hypothetical protein [Aeromonas veronii]|uniref:hypothetical protein n=1 Tax=Aeromonas veronii TaxID=654 RepID=UPI0030E0AD42